MGIIKFIKESGAGFLIKQELNYLKKAVDNPARPFVAIIGGSKVSGKLEALLHLIEKVDKMIIGGGMAFTFLKAQGYEIGKSIFEEELVPKAKEVMETAKKLGIKFYLPVDCVIAEDASAEAETKIVPVQEINAKWKGLDIGPATITLFTEVLGNAKTIVWNGPMGMFEIDAFGRGTSALATALQIPMPSPLSAGEIRMSLSIRPAKAIESRTYQQEAEHLSSFFRQIASGHRGPRRSEKRHLIMNRNDKRGEWTPLFILNRLLRWMDGNHQEAPEDMTRNIKMVLEYDGTRYHGWQRQVNGLTIQEVLEEGISTITQEDIRVVGSGRTDAGVHALIRWQTSGRIRI